MRTTININDALLQEIKTLAKTQNRPLREILEVVLQKGLAAPDQANEPIEIKTFPVGIKPAYRGMSMNQLYDQLESDDTQKVAES